MWRPTLCLFLIYAIGCAARVGSPTVDDLKVPFPKEKTVQGDESTSLALSGDEFWSSSNNVVRDSFGGSATLVAGSNNISWTIYRFTGLTDASIPESVDISFDSDPAEDLPTTVFVGLANFNTRRWEWRQQTPAASFPLEIPSELDFVSDIGNGYIAIVIWDDDYGSVLNLELQFGGPNADWIHTWGGDNSEYPIALDTDLAGCLYALCSPCTLLKFKPNGERLYSLSSILPFPAQGMAIDKEGESIYIYAGGVLQRLNLSGELVWAGEIYLPNDMPTSLATANGRVLVAGDDGGRPYLVCLDADHNIVWNKRVLDGGANQQIAIDGQGGAVWTAGDGESFLKSLRLGSDGEAIWAKAWDYPSESSGPTSVLIDEQDHVLIAGYLKSGPRTPLVLEYSPSGTLLRQLNWDYSFGNCSLSGKGSDFCLSSGSLPTIIRVVDGLTESSTQFNSYSETGICLNVIADESVVYGFSSALKAVDSMGQTLGAWEALEDKQVFLSGLQPPIDITTEEGTATYVEYPGAGMVVATGILDTGGGGPDAQLFRFTPGL